MLLTTGTIAALLLGSPTAHFPDTFSLKFVPTKNSTVSYKINGTFDVQGQLATMDSTVVQKIISVDPNGTYSVQSNTVNGKVIFSGTEMPTQNNTVTIIYKVSGEPVSITGDLVDPLSLRVQNLTMLKRPDNNVKVGDAWLVDIKADAATDKPSLHGTFKLAGEEAVGVVQTLRVEATINEGDVKIPAHTVTTFWISKDDGSIVKYDCKYTNMQFPGAPLPLSGTLSMTRIEAPKS
jgi:hypothetical protein